jgi:anti-anti-sigma factor
MSVQVYAQNKPGVVILRFVGRVSQETVDQFKSLLDPYLPGCAAGKDALILDLSGVEYVSSAGLRVFMLALRMIKSQKGALFLCALQPIVKEIFQVSKFSLLFSIHETVQQAEQACPPVKTC